VRTKILLAFKLRLVCAASKKFLVFVGVSTMRQFCFLVDPLLKVTRISGSSLGIRSTKLLLISFKLKGFIVSLQEVFVSFCILMSASF
jgi:hypothetical protein